MEQAVAETVLAGDAPMVKLRKIYSRMQQIRNLSFEVSKTEPEQKREQIEAGRECGRSLETPIRKRMRNYAVVSGIGPGRGI